MNFLREKNIIQKTHLVKVLSCGEITSKLTISTNGISKSALEKIEKVGGSFTKI
jgi:ribosomal protein L15